MNISRRSYSGLGGSWASPSALNTRKDALAKFPLYRRQFRRATCARKQVALDRDNEHRHSAAAVCLDRAYARVSGLLLISYAAPTSSAPGQ
jgi:hypothetical protein